MTTKRISEKDREFLALIFEASHKNPFCSERRELDRKIAGMTDSKDWKEVLPAALKRVNDFIAFLDKQGTSRIGDFPAEDMPYIEKAYLFSCFHELIGPFDALISRQLEATGENPDVAFAPHAIDTMKKRGFTAVDAERYFSIFFQLRRAYHFIDKSLTGKSRSINELRKALWNNIFTHSTNLYEHHLWNRMEDFSTLITGETGTGKGSAAGAIGKSGYIPVDMKARRFKESFPASFTSINLSQFSETLIESELFGHKRGAFTGAVDSHDGIFARCSPYGSIFLDEIGEVSPQIQIKLLQILQDRSFSPVGSHEKKRFNGRVIAASNRPIDEARADGEFRNDFFYRLCSDIIQVPTLRQRIAECDEELPLLLNELAARITGNKESAGTVAEMVHEAIMKGVGRDYPWPGNVRELEQAVRRILLTGKYSGDMLQSSTGTESSVLKSMQAGKISADELLAEYCRMLFTKYGTYEETARRTGLDRRTAKKYVNMKQ